MSIINESLSYAQKYVIPTVLSYAKVGPALSLIGGISATAFGLHGLMQSGKQAFYDKENRATHLTRSGLYGAVALLGMANIYHIFNVQNQLFNCERQYRAQGDWSKACRGALEVSGTLIASLK